MLYPPKHNTVRPTSKTISFQDIHRHNFIDMKDENYHPNQQLNETTMTEIVNPSLTNCAATISDPNQDENMLDGTKELHISIRRVGMEDHLSIVRLFQTFDQEKYKFIQLPEIHNNNIKTTIIKDGDTNTTSKTSLSLAGLRIDERGGIYLNPLLDTHSAYFKCYVAEDSQLGELVGYILFFNTIDEKEHCLSSTLNSASSPSQSAVTNSTNAVGGNSVSHTGPSHNHDDPIAVIEDLYVKPKYRGHGIATQLWRKVLKSSLDRGCCSCECSLISNNKEGVQFWRRKLGSSKVDTLLSRYQQDTSMLNNQSDSNGTLNHISNSNLAEQEIESQEEIIIELSRAEMKTFYEVTAVNVESL